MLTLVDTLYTWQLIFAGEQITLIHCALVLPHSWQVRERRAHAHWKICKSVNKSYRRECGSVNSRYAASVTKRCVLQTEFFTSSQLTQFRFTPWHVFADDWDGIGGAYKTPCVASCAHTHRGEQCFYTVNWAVLCQLPCLSSSWRDLCSCDCSTALNSWVSSTPRW